MRVFKTISIYLILVIITMNFNSNSSPALNHYKLNSKLSEIKSVSLSKRLDEISGIASTNDGRIFCHTDEEGTVFEIDPNSGDIIKSFSLGPAEVKEDFEGMAISKNYFYLVTSGGTLYRFKEGKKKEKVKYEVFNTPLGTSFDVEGLCYDPETNSLLLACKEFAGRGLKNKRAVYSFSLNKMKLNEKPRFLLSIKEIEKATDKDIFSPSGIERHPKTGTFFLLTGKGRAIVEISKEGKVLSEESLNDKIHKQPEGITFLPDLTMLISDEGAGGKAKLTRYPYY
jgi:uncharacterized protein YjiK